jgi:hypothetical protein
MGCKKEGDQRVRWIEGGNQVEDREVHPHPQASNKQEGGIWRQAGLLGNCLEREAKFSVGTNGRQSDNDIRGSVKKGEVMCGSKRS